MSSSVVIVGSLNMDMVSHSVRHSPDLSPHAAVFAVIITVDEVKQYKPSPDVYYHLAREVGKEDELQDIWLVSGNSFDVVGARSVGMNAIWVEFGKTGALPWPAYDAQRIVYDPATDKAAPEAPFPAERILG